MSERRTVGLFHAPRRFSGPSIHRYGTDLGAALRSLDRAPHVVDVTLELSRVVERVLGAPALRRVGSYSARFPGYMLRVRGARFDVNHVLDHAYGQLVFALDRRRSVVTCHDLFPLKLWRGEIEGLPRRRVRPATVEFSLRGMLRAAAIIVPSAATKADVVELGFPSERTFVVPHGVGPRYGRIGGGRVHSDLLGRHDVRRLLTVDSGVPYKNPRAAIEVLARLVSTFDVRLVRIGSPLAKRERDRSRRLGVEGRIDDLGLVSEADLPNIYRACDVLLFPSFYEGFGWPVLEAMACGTPVVRSTWASLEEITGEDALSAPASNYDALASHVAAILDDATLASDLAHRGSLRAAGFTWRRAAEQTQAVYDAILRDEISASRTSLTGIR